MDIQKPPSKKSRSRSRSPTKNNQKRENDTSKEDKVKALKERFA